MRKKIIKIILAKNPNQLVDLENPVFEISPNHLKEIEKLFEHRSPETPKIAEETLRQLKAQVELSENIIRRACEVATNAWRAKAKMLDPETKEPREEMVRVFRHIENILEGINLMGLRLWDPIDELYDSGMALKVVAFQPTAGMQKERVLETVRPSVYWNDKLIQMGEVVVGTPESSVSGT